MSKYFAMLNAIRQVSPLGVAGKALQIPDICDTIEEFFGTSRDTFRRELVRSDAIADGAIRVWARKQLTMESRYLADEATFAELDEMNTFYYNMDRVRLETEEEEERLREQYEQSYEQWYEDYMNDAYGDYGDDHDW